LERIDELEGSFGEAGPGGDFYIELSCVRIVEMVEFVLFRGELVVRI